MLRSSKTRHCFNSKPQSTWQTRRVRWVNQKEACNPFVICVPISRRGSTPRSLRKLNDFFHGNAISICQLKCARYMSIFRPRFQQNKMSMKAPGGTQVTPERLMQFGSAYAPPLIIGAAARNKVFDTLADPGNRGKDLR